MRKSSIPNSPERTIKALPSPGRTSALNASLIIPKIAKPDNMASFRKRPADTLRRLKKTRIVELLIQIIDLEKEELNDAMLDSLLAAGKDYFDNCGLLSRAIVTLLEKCGANQENLLSYIYAIEDR